jgi:hypothetical protein
MARKLLGLSLLTQIARDAANKKRQRGVRQRGGKLTIQHVQQQKARCWKYNGCVALCSEGFLHTHDGLRVTEGEGPPPLFNHTMDIPHALLLLLELLERVAAALEERKAERKVEHKDGDERDDDGRRGRLADALGAARRRKPPRAADLCVCFCVCAYACVCVCGGSVDVRGVLGVGV